MKVYEVGERRERMVTVGIGTTRLSAFNYVRFDEGDKDRRLVKVEVFRGQRPAGGGLVFAAGWFHSHYRRLTDEEREQNPLPPPPAPRLSWWQRLRARKRLPAARVVEGKNLGGPGDGTEGKVGT
jgi:hypothetical protein